MYERSFQVGPIHQEDDNINRMVGEAVAICLFAVEPPTGFNPEFLNEALQDPSELQRRRQMMLPLISKVDAVSSTNERTVFKVTANALSGSPRERIKTVIDALKSIIDAEDQPLDQLEMTIGLARRTLFNTNEG